MRYLACFLTFVMLSFYACELNNLADEQSDSGISTSPETTDKGISTSPSTENHINEEIPDHIRELVDVMVETPAFDRYVEQVKSIVDQFTIPDFRTLEEAKAYKAQLKSQLSEAIQNEDYETYAVLTGFENLEAMELMEKQAIEQLENMLKGFEPYGELKFEETIQVKMILYQTAMFEAAEYYEFDCDCYGELLDCYGDVGRNFLIDFDKCNQLSFDIYLHTRCLNLLLSKNWRDKRMCVILYRMCQFICSNPFP